MCFLYSIVNNIWVNKIYKAPHWVFIYIFTLHFYSTRVAFTLSEGLFKPLTKNPKISHLFKMVIIY